MLQAVSRILSAWGVIRHKYNLRALNVAEFAAFGDIY